MDSITVRLESGYNYRGTQWVSVAALKTHLRQSNPGCGFLFVSAAASFQTKYKPTVFPHLFWTDRYKSWKRLISPCPRFFMSSLKKGCQIPILCFIIWAGKPYSRSEGQIFTVFVFFVHSFICLRFPFRFKRCSEQICYRAVFSLELSCCLLLPGQLGLSSIRSSVHIWIRFSSSLSSSILYFFMCFWGWGVLCLCWV